MSDVPSIFTFSEDVATAEKPKPLPVGTYTGEIISSEGKKSQNDTMYLQLGIRVSADQFPPDFAEENPQDQTLYYRKQSLEDTPKARHSLRNLTNVLGVVVNKEFDVNSLVGQAALVHVKHEDYQGNTNAVIDKLEAAE